MAQLGTLWFDTRLQDGATADAERIRKELYHKLSNIPITVSLDDSNLSSMRQRISHALSSESFKIKVDIDPSSLANLQKMGGLTEAQANAAKAAAEAALAEQKLATERQRTLIETIKAEKAEMQLDSARQKATASMQNQEKSMIAFRANLNGGITAVSSMTDAMIGLFSISTARQFLSNIVEIGGQLEKQRISMGAILGDTARANTLFNQIKQLAVKSPFGVVELDQYSKQLAAYGVEQSELFDMTKRLADISAGAGQDIGRLALALGHVKSATYLTGITLRQFSMNNIPMLKMLADYYSEVEKRAVSTAEVQKRISQRQVSYEDVVEQIRRMTDEGGMFYNMQEKISESVASKWKNLKDSMDIMYGEMAESALGDVLKNTATMLMNITKNWEDMLAVIGSAAAVWGTWRVALASNNVLLGKNTVLTLNNIKANRQAQSLAMRYAATYRTLNAEEAAAAMGSRNFARAQALHIPLMGKMTAARKAYIQSLQEQATKEIAAALSSNQLIAEELAKAVALGRVDKAIALNAIETSRLTIEEKKAATATVESVGTINKKTIAVNHLSLGLQKLGVAMKSLFLNPQLWIFGLISAATELWMKNKQETERAMELNKQLFEKAQEGIKQTRQMLGETGIRFELDGKMLSPDNFGNVKGGKLVFADAAGLSDEVLQSKIEAWSEYIKNYAATPNRILNEALLDNKGNVRSLAEQYNNLKEAVTDVANAQLYLRQTAEAAQIAMASTGGSGGGLKELFNEDLETNIKDAEELVIDYKTTISKLSGSYSRETSAALKAAKANDEFREAVAKLDAEMLEKQKRYSTSYEQLELLTKEYGRFPKAVDAATESFKKNSDAFEQWNNLMLDPSKGNFAFTSAPGISESLQNAFSTLDKDTEDWANNFKAYMEGQGWEFGSKMGEGMRQAAIQNFIEMTKQAGATSDEVTSRLKKIVERVWGIVITDNALEERKRLSDLEDYLKKICGEQWNIDLNGTNNVSDVISKLRQDYQNAKQFIETNGIQVMAKFGISMTSGGGAAFWSDDWLKKVTEGNELAFATLKQVREAQKIINNVLTISKDTGLNFDAKSTGPTQKKTGGGKSAGAKKDEALENARNRFEELKSFVDEYKKYLKTYHDEDKSIDILEKLYPTTKGKGKQIVEDFKVVLNQIMEDLGNLSTDDRKKFNNTVEKYLADFDRGEVESELDKQLKYLQEYISENAEKYNLYKALFEKTGNEDFARLAFSNGRIFDEYAKELAAKLQEIVGDTVVNFDMSDVDAQDFFKDLPKAYELWKKIVDLTSKNYQDALTKSADAQAKILTNEQKIANLEKKIADAQADTSGVNHDAEIQQWTDEIEKLKSEMFELLPIYEEIFGDRQFKSYNELKRLEKIVRELIENKEVTATDKNGRASYFSSFYMDGDEKHKVDMSRQSLEKLRNVIKDFDKDEKKANPFKALADGIKEMWDKMHDGDAEATSEDWRKLADRLSEVAKIVGDLAGGLSDMFDALGNEGMADAMSDIQAGMNSVNNIAQGFATGGAVGGIISMGSEAVGWVTRIAQKHDKKLDKAIQKSEREVKKLQNAYKNLEWEIGNQLSAVSKQQSAQMIADLEASEKELERQLALERKKKKDDPDKIIDLEQSITEAKQQIRSFYAEMGKERYGLDIDSWASDLANAMVEAFAAGEDAAEAFDQKVADIMKDVVSQIIKINIVKPAMASLQDYLFGSKGIATTNSDNGIEISANEAIGLVKELEKLKSQIDSGSNIYSVVAEAMESMGLDMSGNAKSGGSSLGNSIQGITEDTADLLAGYINSIRADVAMNRELLTVALPSLTVEIQRHSELAQLQVTYQEQIAANTLRNAEAADQIYDLLHRVEIGGSYLNVR